MWSGRSGARLPLGRWPARRRLWAAWAPQAGAPRGAGRHKPAAASRWKRWLTLRTTSIGSGRGWRPSMGACWCAIAPGSTGAILARRIPGYRVLLAHRAGAPAGYLAYRYAATSWARGIWPISSTAPVGGAAAQALLRAALDDLWVRGDQRAGHGRAGLPAGGHVAGRRVPAGDRRVRLRKRSPQGPGARCRDARRARRPAVERGRLRCGLERAGSPGRRCGAASIPRWRRHGQRDLPLLGDCARRLACAPGARPEDSGSEIVGAAPGRRNGGLRLGGRVARGGRRPGRRADRHRRRGVARGGDRGQQHGGASRRRSAGGCRRRWASPG